MASKKAKKKSAKPAPKSASKKSTAKPAAKPAKKGALKKAKSVAKKAAKVAKKAGKVAKKAAKAVAKTVAKQAAKTVAKTVAGAAKKAARVADVNKVAKMGPKPTTTIVQHVFVQATPEQVFDAMVQPNIAATIVGGECTGDPVVGAEFTHWNGYIKGKHVELVRGERIVQEWTTTEWPKNAAPSRLELQLTGTGGGTELTMTHSNVPTEQAEDYRQGWIDYYWTPMRTHFGG